MSVLDAIGNTPLIQLPTDSSRGEIWVKLEGGNPTGSYKDRMALAMVQEAERDGRLAPGQTVVEYTGGSTGSSLALVCALTGHPLRIVTSDAFAPEKLRTMEAFGAELEVIPSPTGITADLITTLRTRAAEIGKEIGAYQTDQFNNRDMVHGYEQMGREIVTALPSADAYCGYIGTAGCFLGVTRALRAAWPDIHLVAVEPDESAVISGRPAGTHRIEGGGVGFVPPQLTPADFDEVIAVSTADAFAKARAAALEWGVFSGPSTGANLVAAEQVATRLGPGSTVVTVQVDTGLKYLAGELFRERGASIRK
ncbi:MULTISPECIES: cysteine synthase family protein [unclassified Salinibacterium]|uniref:PLP-dependent cysteine synthase family protein n=1 Tax=unclassified Salinibacterium TaxID=2632331 RepID=UPI00141F5CB7|nr:MULTISPECIES: cysteine synthase family protein [unclassified Salinibacterium]